jgi:Dihaem cytochrome c
MFDFIRQKLNLNKKAIATRLPLLVLLLISLLCIGLGRGMAFALDTSSLNSAAKVVDTVPSRYQNGLELYLETCSGCHVPIPPEVMPTETWKKLLENPEDHYGQSLTDLIRITQVLIWDYLSAFSRPLTTNEPIPLYAYQSRYFKALHPKVEFSQPVTTETCIRCHPGANKFDYRTLTPEWEDAP